MITEGRFGEHRRCSTTSEVLKHMHTENSIHNIMLQNTKILSVERKWFEGKVKEAISIRLFKPSLNRGGTCYTCPES